MDVCQAGVKSIEGIDSLEGDQIELDSEMNSYRVQHQQLVRSSSGLSDQATSEIADTIVEKLSLLQAAADRTEQQCVELKALLDKAQRASAKYQESHKLLLPWLEKMEIRLESFDLSFETDQDGITPFDQLTSASEEIAERALERAEDVDRVLGARRCGRTQGGAQRDREARINPVVSVDSHGSVLQ